ncbi:unnamed protein product, partial [marine sediment metagenome]
MSSFTKKSILGDTRAIKGLIKFGLVALFFVLGIFGVFFDALAFPDAWNVSFEEDEEYTTGVLTGQKEEWSGSAQYSVSTNPTYIHEGDAGVVGTALPYPAVGTITWIPTESMSSTTTEGIHYLNIPVKISTGKSRVYLYFNGAGNELQLASSATADPHRIRHHGSNFHCDTGEYRGWSEGDVTDILLPHNTWLVWHLAVDFDKGGMVWLSGTINGVRTDYSADSNICYSLGTTDFDHITFEQINYNPFNVIVAFDNINNVGQCSPGSCEWCETYHTCQNVGCCWYYSTWLHENY